MLAIQIALLCLLVVLAIKVVLYAAKNQRIPALDGEEKDFTVRYPPVFLYIAILFFAIVGGLILMLVIGQSAEVYSIVLLCILGAVGIIVLLLYLVFKIKVHAEYIVIVNLFNIKKQIYYKDIKEAQASKYGVLLKTTLKDYRFFSFVVYKEDFLLRLSQNHVKITRI